MHSAEQWSTAMKTVAEPSPRVKQLVESVPHISSGRSMRIVRSWAAGPWACPTRVGASSPAARMRRRTRAFEVRTWRTRRRAQTFRCPSPTNGVAAKTSWICSRSAASLHRGVGPRRCPGRPAVRRVFVAYTVDRGTSHNSRSKSARFQAKCQPAQAPDSQKEATKLGHTQLIVVYRRI